MLLATPRLCRGDPLDTLAAVLPFVDVVQVRLESEHPGAPAAAADVHAWTLQVLELVARAPEPPLVLVNDRVDIAWVLAQEGVAGVHLGRDDFPVEEARRVLGEDALIGLSTRSPAQVAAAQVQPVDYLGFGPIYPTTTKGYHAGLGPEAAWVVSQASDKPVFPIGGIRPENASELAPVGRAAVSSAILGAEDPVLAARAIRGALVE